MACPRGAFCARSRIEARASLSERLDANLAGRARKVPLGPESPDFWKAVAKWGKETEKISGSDRRFAWMYAERLERKLTVSAKYKAWTERKAKEVLRLGFAPPERDELG
jgi:hypothetical protein